MQASSASNGEPQSSSAQQQAESGERRDAAEGPREGEGQKEEQQGKPEQQQGESGPPKGDRPDQPGGKQDQGPKAGDDPQGSGLRGANDVEIWGNLPIHLRDIYRAEGREDLPAQYRDWIDSYYRRLNESVEGGS